MPSASVLRDIEHEQDPFWDALHGQVIQKRQTANTSLGAVLVLGVALIVAARFWFPEDAGTPASTTPQIAINPTGTAAHDVRPSGVDAWLQKLMPSDRAVVAHEDFGKGIKQWIDTGDALARETAWAVKAGAAVPGHLLLWKPTLKSVNYDVEFEAQIQKKAVSWAFRARNSANYYATKIIVRKPGVPSGASIQRIVIQNYKALAPQEFPLPITLHNDQSYQIAFTVHGNRFTTLIDGHLIDEWSDNRYKSGGMGFFSDQGEASAISWVHFAERKGLFSRLFTGQLLFVPPGAPLDDDE